MYDRMAMLRNNALHILSPSGDRFVSQAPSPVLRSVNNNKHLPSLAGFYLLGTPFASCFLCQQPFIPRSGRKQKTKEGSQGLRLALTGVILLRSYRIMTTVSQKANGHYTTDTPHQ